MKDLAAFEGMKERLPNFVGGLGAELTRFYLEPENQAYLFGCMAGAVISVHVRMKTIPALMFTAACGLAARGGWSMVDSIRSDLQQIAQARDDA